MSTKNKRRGLRIRLTRAWLVEVVDQDDCEVDYDWCFGTRKDAMGDGQRMKEDLIRGERLDKMAY